MTIVVSELFVTAIFVVAVAPWLVPDPGGNSKAVGLQLAGWVAVTSPFYWLLLLATVAGVIWLFKRLGRIHESILVYTAVLISSALLYGQTPPASGPGQITGIVLNEDGQPVAHAAACISAQGSSKTECSVLTDEGGQFEIQHLASGTATSTGVGRIGGGGGVGGAGG